MIILMDGLDRLLRLLEGGEWHRVEDIAAELVWSTDKTEGVVKFLVEHELISYRELDRSVKIDSQLRALLVQH